MRTIILLASLVFISLSCQKEDDPIVLTPSPPIILKDLHLTWANDAIPTDLLATHKTAVFVSSKGKEKRIAIEYISETNTHHLDTLSYKTDRVIINYTDNDEKHFGMYIYASSDYQSVDSFYEFVRISLGEPSDEIHRSEIMFGSGIVPVLNRFIPELTVAGITFKHVYSDFNSFIPPYSFYTEVYYTLEQGIVGFQGQNDEFWGLKGYE